MSWCWCAGAGADDGDSDVHPRDGRPDGSANAVFETTRDAKRVVAELHRRDMGSRYIECFYDEFDD